MTENRADKNSVFEAFSEMGATKGLVVQSREEQILREFGLDIPASQVPLPSEGKVYPTNHALHNQSSVDIKQMSTREEDLLISKNLIKTGKVISELIKSCLLTPGVDVGTLISGDRNALMVAIRIVGYGANYQASMECSNCNVKNEIDFDLSSLNIKNLEIEPVSLGENRFTYTLPQTKAKVEFRFLTGKDEEEILATAEARKKKGMQNDNSVSTRLQYNLVSVNGITDRNKLIQFISVMPARDSSALRSYIDQHEPKIDMGYDFTCQHCDHSEETVLPLGVTFFWPNAGRSRSTNT